MFGTPRMNRTSYLHPDVYGIGLENRCRERGACLFIIFPVQRLKAQPVQPSCSKVCEHSSP